MKLTENPAKNRLLARLVAFILFLFLLLLLSSCKTTSNTTDIVPVHSATHDTILLSKVKIRHNLYRPMAAYRAQGRHGVLRQSENRVSLPPPQRYSL